MRYDVRVGDARVQVETAPDGRFLVDDRAVALESVRVDRDTWSMRVDGRSHEVRVVSRVPLRLAVDGTEVAVAVTDERELAAARSNGQLRAGRHEVRAPMPGLLKRVHVKEGDAVERGAQLVTLEAMKMENELTAPDAGTVARIAAAEGTKVEGGALLVVIAART